MELKNLLIQILSRLDELSKRTKNIVDVDLANEAEMLRRAWKGKNSEEFMKRYDYAVDKLNAHAATMVDMLEELGSNILIDSWILHSILG